MPPSTIRRTFSASSSASKAGRLPFMAKGKAPSNRKHPGRIRSDLPRNTSLGAYTDTDIDDVIWNLNATIKSALATTLYC
jgi:hypothetical protein